MYTFSARRPVLAYPLPVNRPRQVGESCRGLLFRAVACANLAKQPPVLRYGCLTSVAHTGGCRERTGFDTEDRETRSGRDCFANRLFCFGLGLQLAEVARALGAVQSNRPSRRNSGAKSPCRSAISSLAVSLSTSISAARHSDARSSTTVRSRRGRYSSDLIRSSYVAAVANPSSLTSAELRIAPDGHGDVLRACDGQCFVMALSRPLLLFRVAPNVWAKLFASYATFSYTFNIRAPLYWHGIALAPFGNGWGLDTKRDRESGLCSEDCYGAI